MGRAVPATHLSVARSRPAGRSADCHTSAVDHPARRRPDRYGCASVPAGGRLPDHVLPAGHPRGAGAAVDHPAVRRPGTAVGRSTAHPAVPRPATAADLARNRSGRAAPAPDPDADWRRGHAADASRVGASLRSACCALSPGQRNHYIMRHTGVSPQAFVPAGGDWPAQSTRAGAGLVVSAGGTVIGGAGPLGVPAGDLRCPPRVARLQRRDHLQVPGARLTPAQRRHQPVIPAHPAAHDPG